MDKDQPAGQSASRSVKQADTLLVRLSLKELVNWAWKPDISSEKHRIEETSQTRVSLQEWVQLCDAKEVTLGHPTL